MSTREDWQRRLGPLYGGAVALVHSTPWRWPSEVGDEARSAGWIVALGVPIGLVAWLVAILVKAAGIPVPIAGILGLAMLSAASAALVERGVADYLDQWHDHRGRRARHDGTNAGAILVLVFYTVVRVAALMVLPPSAWPAVFVATAVVGRWAAVFLQALGDPIAHDEAQRSLVAVPAPAWLTAAISAAVLALAILAIGKAGIVALALAALAAFALGLATQRRDGGLSPAVVAVAAAVAELLFLLVATIGR